jgi:hypothetical protein
MVMEQIDDLKRRYTDKYVQVDARQPELARFRDVVGQVKTVNMSGRALVEFQDYHVNIGWYDIDPSFLKVVDKPAPKPKEAPAKKAAAPAAKKETGAATGATAKKLSPLEMARAQGAAGKRGAAAPAKPAGGKPSTADILAAARAGKAPVTKMQAEAAPATKPAPATTGSGPAKVDRSKMSVADMLAAARAGGAAGAAPPEKAQAAPATVDDQAAAEAAPAPLSASSESAVKIASGEKVDKSKMTIDEMIAWCRQHDSK